MITIQVLGLDEFVVGRYSRENSGNLAQSFECEESEISFFAPNAMMFHNGVEQTSWNTVVIVLAPEKYRAVESQVADTLLKTLNAFSINVDVVFQYFDESRHYSYVNPEYPRFISTEEIRDDYASMEFGEVPEHMEGDEDAEDFEEGVPEESAESAEEEVYLGDAFEGFDEAYEASRKKNN